MDAYNTGPLWLADSQPLTLHLQLVATCLQCRKSSLVTQIHFDTYQLKLKMNYFNTISFSDMQLAFEGPQAIAVFNTMFALVCPLPSVSIKLPRD
jgi:hypothetical protein